MTSSAVEARPSDWLLAWLSARGDASRPTVDRACRAIAERFDPNVGAAGTPTSRYAEPLRRIGHVEEVRGGIAVAPTTLCWTRQDGRGVIVGARDGFLREELRRRLGPHFVASHPAPPWPETWRVVCAGDAIAAMDGLGVEEVHEPGMRLLASLPTLEDAIAAWPATGPPSALSPWEVIADPAGWRWAPTGVVGFLDGLVRPTAGRRRTWSVVRGGVGRPLDSPERRAVAWWAEMARIVRPGLVLHRAASLLVLPASRLPPPAMVERPLIWASGSPPVRDSRLRRSYEAIDPGRAAEVARVLGLILEDAS